ncbi:MAG: hypothetical protein IPK27_02650 [Rhodanobacteraceae bacterium]|nr:hypothetical protein [Rhodanobacteraceae bacterium]
MPLLGDPLITGGLLRVFLLASVICAAMMSLIFAVQGEYDAIGPIWLAFLSVGAGLAVLAVLVMLLVFGNRMHCRFSVDGDGIEFATIDRRARAGNRLLLALGLLRGSAQATGAGLIATTQEQRSLRWRGAFRAEYRPQRHQVILCNRWRRLLVVYATPENYAAVAQRIADEIQRHGTAGRLPLRSPLPRYLGWSALLVLACVPLFAAVDAFDLSLLLPLLQLCFGLATIWLIGLFGWVLIGVDLMIVGALLLGAFSVRESWIHRGETYAAWTVYGGDDWSMLAVLVLALAALAWIGWRGARGKLPALLVADFGDSGE